MSDPARAFLAGCVGGAYQMIPCTPMELVKCNLQARVTPNSQRYFIGPIDCLKDIYRQRGIRGCFRGLPVQSVRDILGYGFYTGGEVFFLGNIFNYNQFTKF